MLSFLVYPSFYFHTLSNTYFYVWVSCCIVFGTAPGVRFTGRYVSLICPSSWTCVFVCFTKLHFCVFVTRTCIMDVQAWRRRDHKRKVSQCCRRGLGLLQYCQLHKKYFCVNQCADICVRNFSYGSVDLQSYAYAHWRHCVPVVGHISVCGRLIHVCSITEI